ncbi:Fc.00g049410.m01.CDS01 [Cosmosporella sp. VM-42]
MVPLRRNLGARLATRGGLSHRGRSLSCQFFPRSQASKILLPSLPSRNHSTHIPPPPPLQSRVASPLLIIALLITGGIYYLSTPSTRPTTLNNTTFVPYTITSREAISPTSFVITIEPQTPNPSPPYLNAKSTKWRWPLWSVEFKHPQVQIARHYTPIPPLGGDDGSLKFYIRAVGDGEMSNYLCRRQVGEEVYLRGPHVGFELEERLGARDRVVFLAGGTGVVPGMQAAKAVLDGKRDVKVDLLWAVRKREEIQHATPVTKSSWKWWQEKQPKELGVDTESPSPIARRLNEMKSLYGPRLNIQVVVDEEGTQVRENNLKAALRPSTSSLASASSNGCRFHDQKMHEYASEFAPEESTDCACSAEGAVPGKNLLIVSGPDGFVSHYAGEKVWLGGHHTQGPVGGVVGRLQRQYPQLAQDWIVLKL